MGTTKLKVLVQDFSAGLTGALSWLDKTTDCKLIEVEQGHEGPRQFMPKVGRAVYQFNNTSGAYTPVSNRENANNTVLEVGRRIRHTITLPTHGKLLQVAYTAALTLNAGYLSQTVAGGAGTKDRIVLEFEARCESGYLKNAIRAELRTNAPEVCEGQVFSLTRKWRKYRLSFLAQSNSTTLTVRFYNIFTSDSTPIQFRNMSLVNMVLPFVNLFSNANFTNGTTSWAGTNATLAALDDYEIKFDGKIQNIEPSPFALAGDQVTTVTAVDGEDKLENSTAKFALQKNKRADELIQTVLSTLPAVYWLQTSPGALLSQGHQTFDRSFTGYTEKETTLADAINDAVQSENGMFWIDQDGTFRFESNTFHSRRQRREGIPRPSWHIFQANPADGDRIELWTETYRFKNTPIANYDVKIGTTARDTAQNLTNAINMDAASMGSGYFSTTPISSTSIAKLGDYPTVVLEDAPELYYRVGESTGLVAFDASGKGNNGTYAGGITLGVTGALPSDNNTGVSGDGTDDRVGAPSLALYYTSFSVEMWIKPAASPAAFQDLFSAYNSFVLDRAFYIRLNSSGSLTVDFFSDGFTTSAGLVAFGGSTYYHLVVTYEVVARLLTVYLNGLQVGQATIGFFDSTANPTITFGGFPAVGSTYYKGAMDELALYLKTLAPERVATHYAARYAGVSVTKHRNNLETPEMNLVESNHELYEMRPVRSLATVINKHPVTWTPRQTTTGIVVLGQIQSPIQIPPRSSSTHMFDVKPGYRNVDDGRVGMQDLTISFRDAAGNTIGGDNIIDPVATTDYRVFEQSDPIVTGYEYTTQTKFFWISDIEKSASQIKLKLNNNAIGGLYATMFQVRGNAIYTYDEQEELSTNPTSIALYQERQRRRELPFTNDQQFAKSLSGYTVERYGYPFVEAQYIETKYRATLNGEYLLNYGLMDTAIISDARSGLSNVRHMIVRISSTLVPNAADYIEKITFTLERLDQNQYFLLSDPTQGVIDGVNRLYI